MTVEGPVGTREVGRGAAVVPLKRTTRLALVITGTGALVLGCSLSFLAEDTDRYFAWTIEPPLMAAFLGADYWAAAAICFLCAREGAWARARAFSLAFLVGGTLLLLVTLLHLERFHMDSATGWAWLILYVIFPPGMVVALLRQRRLDGNDPPTIAPTPAWLRLVLGIQSAGLVTVGAALVVAPDTFGSIWPWTLTTLTGRVTGVFVLAQGILFAGAWRERDWSSIKVVMMETALIGGLQLLAVARFAGDMEWEEPTAWLYVLAMVWMLGLGLHGSRAARRAERGPLPA